MSAQVIFVEGNIGSGKTKFLSQIEKYYGDDCQVIYEPLDTWTSLKDENGTNILDHFYKDAKKYAYTFQNVAFMSKIKKLEEIDYTKKYVFIERSIWSDKNVFAKNCALSKLINSIEYQVYLIWFDWIESVCRKPQGPNHFLYLRCSPETSFARVNKRGRVEESSIPLEYLAEIHKRHDDWLIYDKEVELNNKCFYINAEQDLTVKENFVVEYEKVVSMIHTSDHKNNHTKSIFKV